MSGYPEGTRLFVADMGPVERAYAEAEHETCEDPPKGHPLTAHEPWSGGDLDGVETWETFTARLFRHGLTLTMDPERLRALQAPLTEHGDCGKPCECFQRGRDFAATQASPWG